MPDLPGIRLLWTGQARLGAWWRLRLERGAWCCYVHDARGAELILPGGGVLAMGPGEAVLIPPWSPVSGRATGTPRQAWAVFDTPGIDGGLLAGLEPRVVRRGVDLAAWSAGLPLEASGDPAAGLRLCAWLAALAAEHLAVRPVHVPDADLAAARRRIAPAVAAIEAAPGRPHRVAGLARACGIGPDHLARCFRRAVGRSPLTWLRERRVQAAAELLLRGDGDIAAVARACGFAERYHFSRVFSRQMGMGPAAYRRRMGTG